MQKEMIDLFIVALMSQKEAEIYKRLTSNMLSTP